MDRNDVLVHFEGLDFEGAFVLEALVGLIFLLSGGWDFLLAIVPLLVFVDGLGDVVLGLVLFVAGSDADAILHGTHLNNTILIVQFQSKAQIFVLSPRALLRRANVFS